MSIPAQYGTGGYESAGHEPTGYPPEQHAYGMPDPGTGYAHAAQTGPLHPGGWPANELEEVLTAALGDPGADRPAPGGAGPLPAVGAAAGRRPAASTCPPWSWTAAPYVPVFSSEEQFRRCAPGMAFGVVPAREFARGLPPLVGIAVNPGGFGGHPAAGGRGGGAVPRRCGPGGARVRLWEPLPDDEPVDFLAAAAGEFAITPVVLSAPPGPRFGGGRGPTRCSSAWSWTAGRTRTGPRRWTRWAGRWPRRRCRGR